MKQHSPLAALLPCLMLLGACSFSPLPVANSASNLATLNPPAAQSGSQTALQPNDPPNAQPSGNNPVGQNPDNPISPPATAVPPVSGSTSRIARIEILGERFLNAKGESARLSFQLYDAAGQVIDPASLPLQLVSTRPEQIAISPDGTVTALVEEGFSWIEVSLPGTDLLARQLISVSNGLGGECCSLGSAGGGSVDPEDPEESVSADVSFEYVEDR
ncbi:MAG: hypothetical protein ACAI44_20210 [Candidatus Sericytochromatia bacterium]